MAGGIGDRAGFAQGMKIIGVNNKTFSTQRLLDALAQSGKHPKIEFLLVEGENFRTIVLDYSGGLRYLELVRDPAKPDLLAEILKPGAERKPEPAAKPKEKAASLTPPKGYVCYQSGDPHSDRRPPGR